MVLALAAFAACTKEKDPNLLIIANNANYPPYEFVNKQGELVGLDIDVAHALAKELGKKLIIKEMDFDAQILALKQGKVDLIISGLYITPSRSKEIFLVPYIPQEASPLSVIFWKKKPEINSLSDLENYLDGKPVTIQSGNYLEGTLQGFGRLNVRGLNGPTEQILDLKYQKSEAAAVETFVAKTLTSGNENLYSVELALPSKDQSMLVGIGVAKFNSGLRDKIEHAVDSLKKDGSLGEIVKKWRKI